MTGKEGCVLSWLVVRNLLRKEDFGRKLEEKIEKYYDKMKEHGYLDKLDVRTATKFIALWAVSELKLEIIDSMDLSERMLETMLQNSMFEGWKNEEKERTNG